MTAMRVLAMTGYQEILVVLLVILLLFGARKLPELARSLGKSLGEFKKGRREGDIGPETSESGGRNRESTGEGETGDQGSGKDGD